MSKQKYNRIKVVLAEQEKSAKWLSEQLDRDKSTVSRWCTNDMQPTIETFYKIAEVLDIDVRELLLEENKNVLFFTNERMKPKTA